MKLKRIILLLLTVMFSFSYGEVFAKDGNSLKKALKNKFLIGVSVNTHQSSGKDVAAVEIVKKNFNSIVAENCMKFIRKKISIILRRQMNLSVLVRAIKWLSLVTA